MRRKTYILKGKLGGRDRRIGTVVLVKVGKRYLATISAVSIMLGPSRARQLSLWFDKHPDPKDIIARAQPVWMRVRGVRLDMVPPRN